MKIAFTGHRPNKLGGYESNSPTREFVCLGLREKLKAAKALYTEVEGITGMALGVDQWAAEECHFLRIPFIAAIPFEGQELLWPEPSQKLYREILAKADSKVIVSPGGFAAWKMQVRNEWMVDRCDMLFAVWDGSPGGTANCVRYAASKGKHVVRVPIK